MYLDAVDSTGVSQDWMDQMIYWREWFDDEVDTGELRCVLCFETNGNINSGTRRDAEYVVQCLQVILPLEIERNRLCTPEKKKTAVLDLDGCSDEAIDVFCEFLRQPSTQMVALCLSHSFPEQQYQRLFDTLSTHTSVKDLTIQRNSQCALCVCNLLLARNDFIALRFDTCRFRMADILILLPGFRRGQAHLQALEIYNCDIRDEGVRLFLEAIQGGGFPVLTKLSFCCNKIKANGLRCMAELGPVALGRLQVLILNHNGHLFDDLEIITFFVQTMLLSDDMSIKELCIRSCGQHVPIIIKACESLKNKLQVLAICDIKLQNVQPVHEQLVASLPKMVTLQRVTCPLFAEDEQASMVAAFQQNTSMVEFDFFDNFNTGLSHEDKMRRIVALRSRVEPIMHRNQILKNADALVALQPKTQLPIDFKSGIWYMAFAKMGEPFTGLHFDDDDDTVASVDNNAFSVQEQGAEDIELLQDDDGKCEDRDSSSNQDDDGNGEDSSSSSNHGKYTGASAIFKILQKRPGILEKRLRRPTAVATSTGHSGGGCVPGKDNDGAQQDTNGGRKRRRL